MKINKSNHLGASFLTIKNNAHLEVTLCNLGASIYSVKYFNKTITYHPEDFKEFFNCKKYCGKSLGRIAGRIKKGLVVIKGKKYQLEINEHGNTLHGGVKNISFRKFNVEVKQDKENIKVIYTYLSKELECGFPGNVLFTITYEIKKNKDEFSINYHAHTDKDTPINMSTHTYWRLTGKDVLDHTLKIRAKQRTVVNPKDLITIGKKPLESIFDFNKTKKIGKDIERVAKLDKLANGYDHGYIFTKGKGPEIVLSNNGIKLSIKSDAVMVNIYANCYPLQGLKMKDYGLDKLYGGIAIEPQTFFTSYKDLIVTPKKDYDQTMTFTLEKK